MGRKRIPSNFFVFVIVEHDGHILLVRERKHGQLWYAPAGGLEPGETIWEAGIRETMEEAGIRVEPTSLLRVEQNWFPNETPAPRDAGLTSWWRFVMRARPVSTERAALVPKSKADEHTLEARWILPHNIHLLPLRHTDVLDLVGLAIGTNLSPKMASGSNDRPHLEARGA